MLIDDEPRRWRTADGEREYVGKFVAADETSVVMKPLKMVLQRESVFGFVGQADGERITLVLSELSAEDQEYVKLRLAAEKGRDIFFSQFEGASQ